MSNDAKDKYVVLNTKITIVVAGQFHPGVFTPDWFRYHKIVSKEDCDKAEIKFIEASVINIDFAWFRWFSDPQRIIVELLIDGDDDRLLDLLRSILVMFSYTKVTAIGVNFEFQINFNKKDDWHALGHHLAPKDVWKNSFGHDELHYGMKQTSIQVDDFYDENSTLNITVRAANDHKADPKHTHRAAFEFNNHFSFPEQNDWNERVEKILDGYYTYKKNNTEGYEKLLSIVLGGVQ
ncbi:hypothetical protein AT03_11705 [Hafnia alvei FB1]|uniref:Uncharacterized protein n=1 Tax=Hafnia alvei FB1 TaxID=1453496 RepID=A0A097R2N1_HAFAL|nr:hypothetical protein [Hafnia alvei]AIU72984.1 hypothetical protein AT03_11705 [Hafnia alvei FB1]